METLQFDPAGQGHPVAGYDWRVNRVGSKPGSFKHSVAPGRSVIFFCDAAGNGLSSTFHDPFSHGSRRVRIAPCFAGPSSGESRLDRHLRHNLLAGDGPSPEISPRNGRNNLESLRGETAVESLFKKTVPGDVAEVG